MALEGKENLAYALVGAMVAGWTGLIILLTMRVCGC